MNNDSKWGDPRGHQIDATFYGEYTTEVVVQERRICGLLLRSAGLKKKTKYGSLSLKNGDVFPDHIYGRRTFKYRCGLIKAINVMSGSKSFMTMYLDGFSNIVLDVGQTEFQFDSKLGGTPIAEITYSGDCTRHGEMKYGTHISFVSFIFRDEVQMRESLVATTATPDPERQTIYRSQASTTSPSLWPLAAGFLLCGAIGE